MTVFSKSRRQVSPEKMGPCTSGRPRRPAAGLATKMGDTKFRHNKVMCSVCDIDDGNVSNRPVAGSSKSTPHRIKSDGRRLPAIQRSKNLAEMPNTCDRDTVRNTHWRRHDPRPWATEPCLPASLPVHTDNWFTKEHDIVTRETKKIQQMKDRDAYYKEKHEKLHGRYKDDLKQAERDVRAGKHKRHVNKPEASYHIVPLSKEEQYAEELKLARISYNQQRKKCASNNPLHTSGRIPPIPTKPPGGSTIVEIPESTVITEDEPTTKLFTGDEQRKVIELYEKGSESRRLHSESLALMVQHSGSVADVLPESTVSGVSRAESSLKSKVASSSGSTDNNHPKSILSPHSSKAYDDYRKKSIRYSQPLITGMDTAASTPSTAYRDESDDEVIPLRTPSKNSSGSSGLTSVLQFRANSYY